MIIKSGIFDNLSSFNELEQRIDTVKSINNRGVAITKGDVFEIFIEALLNINNKYRSEVVYPSGKIPFLINQKLKLNINEKGHDGIYKKDNHLACYQVKFRKGESLSWDELSTFIGVSEKADIRHLFTNCSKISQEFLNKSRVRITSRKDLVNLKKNEFQEIEAWLKNKKIKIDRHVPEPYQKEAIKNIFKDLKKHDRTTAIMACGSGKTDVGLWVYEKINPNLSIVFVPSIALVKQIRSDWLEQTLNKEIKTIQVCSAKHKTDREDSIILNEIDLDFKITLEKNEIKNFLIKNKNFKKVIFSTYQSSDVLAQALKGIKVDFAVFDEAHRTATLSNLRKSKVSNFQLPLFNENIFIQKRLFMTATRRISNKKTFRKEGDPKLLLSMDNEVFYGKISHNLSFYKAMQLGCIAKFKIAYSIVTSDEVDTYQRKTSATLIKKSRIKSEQVAKQIALKKIIRKLNIKKVFSFHRTVSRAKSFIAEGPEGFGSHLSNFYCNHVDGTMKISDREKIIENFKNSNNGILSNARCLIEGVDVPSVELVSFTDSKNSEIDIIQSAGRALRNRNVNKKFGYLFVPIFVENKKKENIKDALVRSNYELIAEILNAIKDHDKEIAQIIKDYYTDDTKGFNNVKRKFNELFIGDKNIISLDVLNKKIKNKIKDRVLTRWDFYLDKLKKYIKKNKHSLTPIITLNKKKLSEEDKFFQWIHNIKLRKRSNDLMSYQIEELEDVGINWKIKGETLEENDIKDLVSVKNLKKRYFWFHRQGKKLIKPKGSFYSTTMSEYYDKNKILILAKKFEKIIHPHDKRYVSKFQIIISLNLQSAKSKKRDSNYHKLLDNWITKTKIKPAGQRASKYYSGNYDDVYPKKIIRIIKIQNRLIDPIEVDNKKIFSRNYLSSYGYRFKYDFIDKNFKIYGYSVINRLQTCYHINDIKFFLDKEKKYREIKKDKRYILIHSAVKKYNFFPLNNKKFRNFHKIKTIIVETTNGDKSIYVLNSQIKKIINQIKKNRKFDHNKYISFTELNNKIGAGGNSKLIKKAFKNQLFKIKGYFKSPKATYESNALPFILRNKKNLNIIKTINDNINIPSALVGPVYLLKKYKIYGTQVNNLISKKILKVHSFRTSTKNPLSTKKNVPYFEKKYLDKTLGEILNPPKNIVGLAYICKHYKIQYSTIKRWIKFNFIKPDYYLITKKNLNKMPYFKLDLISVKVKKAIRLSYKKKVKDNTGSKNPMFGKKLTASHRKKISIGGKGILKPRDN